LPSGTPTAADLEAEVGRIRCRLDANLSAAEAAMEQAVKEPTVEGSTGQPKPNPLFEVAAKCDELVLRYSDQLDGLLERLENAQARELSTEQPRLTWPCQSNDVT
jgi:hypothetical protein